MKLYEMMKKYMLIGMLLAVSGVGLSQMAIAGATDNVTNLINRLDPVTANVLSNFVMLTDIPRPTYHEQQVSDALFAWATARGFSPRQGAKNNLWFDVPATPGMEAKPMVMLQGHMDMVAVGFDNPETESVVLDCDEEGKIFSKNHKTSIGSDDGIGVSMALAVAEGKIPHGPMRVLLTTDEEQTQTGALAVPVQLFYGVPYLINIDSETDGEITISSAANCIITVTGAVTKASVAKSTAYCIDIKNFRGGHSGTDAGTGRLNAIIELGRILTNAVAQGVDFELAEFTGGDAGNAIPPHAQAKIVIDSSKTDTLEGLLTDAQAAFQSRGETEASVIMTATNGITTVLNKLSQNTVLTYLTTVHDGVWNWSETVSGLVETSMNHGQIRVTPDGVWLKGAARGSVEAELTKEENSIKKTATECGYSFDENRACAPWPANVSNPLIGIFSNAWEKVTGEAMNVVAVHAGLECGWFSQKASGMNIVSVGPTIKDPHTANETISVASISNNVQLLTEVLSTLYHRYQVKKTELVLLAEGGTYSNPPYDGNGALAEIGLEGRFDGTDVTFVDNEVTGDGGVVYCLQGGQFKLFGQQVVFSNNTAKSIGGAICNFGEVYFNATNTIFNSNKASNNGGAIHNEFGVIMSGIVDLQTETDTWVNFGKISRYAEVYWNLMNMAEPSNSVCIKNYQYFTNATDYVRLMLRVSQKQPLGDYTIATNIGDDLTGKDKFLLVRMGSTEQESITTNGQEVMYKNRTYKLSRQDQNLVLTVGRQPVYITTNSVLDVEGMTWQLVDSDKVPYTEVDDEGRFIVQSNSVVNVLYTTEKGKAFKDGSTTFVTGFKATGAAVFDAAEQVAGRIPNPSDIGEPKVQLGVVAQRYPWNGMLDVQYRALYVPSDKYRLKLKIDINGLKKVSTTTNCIETGVSTITYDLTKNFGEVKAKNCKVTAELVENDNEQ